MRVSFTIALATKPLWSVPEGNVREHWSARARRARAHRSFTRSHLLALGKTVPKLPATVTFTRVSAGMLDDDNMRSAMKHFRDEVAAYLKHQGKHGNWWEEVPPGHGDDASDPVSWKYKQEKAPRGKHAVRIEIVEDEL